MREKGSRGCKGCIWYEDCKAAGELHGNCKDHSPLGDDPEDEQYYIDNVKSREAQYNEDMRRSYDN